MFAGMVMLGAPYTLKMNEHVRVDLFYGMMSERARLWIDIVCGFLFLLPFCMIMIYFTWPWFVESWHISETSSNAGGLIRWPVKLMLPVGFALMALQGVSEIIKRIAALEHVSRSRIRLRKAAAMNVHPRQHGAPDVRGHDAVHVDRLSGGVLARGDRTCFSALSASSSV